LSSDATLVIKEALFRALFNIPHGFNLPCSLLLEELVFPSLYLIVKFRNFVMVARPFKYHMHGGDWVELLAIQLNPKTEYSVCGDEGPHKPFNN